jgi:hypothetical protein
MEPFMQTIEASYQCKGKKKLDGKALRGMQ